MNQVKGLFLTLALLSTLIFPTNIFAATVQEKVAGLYIAFFNRAPDKNGLKYWQNQAATLGEESAVKILASGFATNVKFTSLYGEMNNQEFVRAIYLNTLGQAGDSEGIAYWTGLLDNGMSRSDMVANFVSDALDFDRTSPAFANLEGSTSPYNKSLSLLDIAQQRHDLLANKVALSLKFVELLGYKTNLSPNTDVSDPNALDVDKAYKASVNLLHGVTYSKTTKDKVLHLLNLISSTPSFAIDIINRLKEQYGSVMQDDQTIKLIQSLMENVKQYNSNFGTITSPVTGRVWMDRNLGASEVCTSSDDENCYGDYYQWGRYPDGYEKADSAITRKVASSYLPDSGKFVVSSYDWTTLDRSGTDRSKHYNICPVGFRLPSIEELKAEKISNSNDAFNSLRLPTAGERTKEGYFEDKGDKGYLLSTSSVYANNYKLLNYNSGYASYALSSRAAGVPVRCIKIIEPTRWVTSDWGSCQVACGTKNGYQSRSVTCQDGLGNILNDSYCTDPKPKQQQSCMSEYIEPCSSLSSGQCPITTQSIVEGEIVEVGDTNVSVDKWYIHHNGGPLVINLLSEMGNGITYTDINNDGIQSNLDTYIYLFKDNGSFNNLIDDNDDAGTSGLAAQDGTLHPYDSLLSIVNLPAGNYVLAVSAYNFSQSEASGSSNETDWYYRTGPYRITFDGDAYITGLPSNATKSCALYPENNAPIANAGADQSVNVGDTVHLDGSQSSDAEGGTLLYSWSIVSQPTGSTATLSNETTVNPTFIPDVAGDYTIRLVVNDRQLDSDPDEVTISVNAVPVADAGADQTVNIGNTVQLDGSTSSDADGDPLTYSWTITSKPAGSSAVLSDATAVKPTFTADVNGSYVFSLVVNDGMVDSAPDSVIVETMQSSIVVFPTMDTWVYGGYPTKNYSQAEYLFGNPVSHCNSAMARAYIYFDISGYPDNVTSVVLGVTHAPQTTCYSNCSADFYFYPVLDSWQDDTLNYNNMPSEGNPVVGPIHIQVPNNLGHQEYDITELYRKWKNGTLSNHGISIHSPTIGCNNASSTFLVYSLEASDPNNRPYIKIITTNNSAPVANAGADQTVTQGASVTLDASGSSDSDGTIVSYEWKEGSTVLSTDSSFSKSDFTVGTHTITLTVTDNDGATASDTVVITVNGAVGGVLKKTGQTKSYDVNGNEVTDSSLKDDGFYQKGVTPSYTRDNTNDIVTDNLTGLMWQDDADAATVTKQWLTNANYTTCSNDTSSPACDNTSGDTAATYCSDLTLGGYTDWRLPTSSELEGIVDYGKAYPAIDTAYFNNVSSYYYWSSTTYEDGKDYAWVVGFDYGYVYGYGKDDNYYVSCVRDGQ